MTFDSISLSSPSSVLFTASLSPPIMSSSSTSLSSFQELPPSLSSSPSSSSSSSSSPSPSPSSSLKLQAVDNNKVKSFDHQIAGHIQKPVQNYCENLILKPLHKQHLFYRELAFYESVFGSKSGYFEVKEWNSNEQDLSQLCGHMNSNFIYKSPIANDLKKVLPNYHGIIGIETENNESLTELDKKSYQNNNISSNLDSSTLSPSSSSLFSTSLQNPSSPTSSAVSSSSTSDSTLIPCLILSDLTHGFSNPCIIDIKIGRQTYEPTSSPEKQLRSKSKCPQQYELGFRITGGKVWNHITKKFINIDKNLGRSLLKESLNHGLSIFFFNGINFNYPELIKFISNLEEMYDILKGQNYYVFICSSILAVYDSFSTSPIPSTSDSMASDNLCRTCLIDFAHILPNEGAAFGLHEGFVYGLSHLINCLKEISVVFKNYNEIYRQFYISNNIVNENIREDEDVEFFLKNSEKFDKILLEKDEKIFNFIVEMNKLIKQFNRTKDEE